MPNRTDAQTKDAPAARPTIVAAVHATYPPRARVARSRHRWWVLDYNFNDIGRVSFAPRGGAAGSGSRGWERREPAGHLYAPLVEYVEEFPAARMLRTAYVIFTDGASAGIDRLLSRFGGARFLDPDGRLGAMLIELAAIDRGATDASACDAQAMLWRIFALLHRAERVDEFTYRITTPSSRRGRGGARTTADDFEPTTLAARVAQYLRVHLSEPVSLRDLATHLGISESHVSHAYRKESGETPMATLLRLRIDVAKGLLVKGGPLKWIAEQTGFTDAFHFSRMFKRVTGQPPSRYRLDAAGDAR